MAAEDRDLNRDPITDEPGAHPVGTGVGATGGAIAGAAAGTIAGPVGTMVGGVIGAVVGGLAGKAALAAYAGVCLARPARSVRRRPDVSAAEAWRRARIPPDVVDILLRPFLSGVLLEQDMSSSRRFTDLMLKMFARGASTVPAGGMQRLPEQIAGHLPHGCLRTGVRVHAVTPSAADTDEGPVSARAVVVATDGWTAAGLLSGRVEEPAPRGVTTVYHAAPDFPEATGMLLLGPGGSPVANSIAISVAAPEYAPSGQVLVSSSLVHGTRPTAPVDADGPDVRSCLARLHNSDTSSWQHVATYDLPRALPGMPAPHPMRRPVRLVASAGPVYVAGDHRDTSSIQGALVSGRRCAEAVLADLGTVSRLT